MNRIIVAVFGLVLTVSLVTQVIPDQAFSEQENRYLQTMPAFSWNNIVSGKFTSQFETYIQDHFFLRDEWMKAKTFLEQMAGKQESNGVYLGDDGWYYEVDKGPDEDQMKTNTEYLVNWLAWLENQGIDASFLPIYSSYMFYEENLPANHLNDDQHSRLLQLRGQLPNNILVDSFGTFMQHKQEDIYFKTDHHWTQLGAYYAYEDIAKQKGWEVLPLDAYLVKQASHPFYGTLYSKAPRAIQIGDDIVYYVDQTNQYELFIPETNERFASLYIEELLDTKDQYAMFLGGNNGITIINKQGAPKQIISESSETSSKSTLVVFKDSYFHALAPFLAQHYDEIVLIDLRYFNGSVREYVSSYQPDEVMVAYNLSWFGSDRNLAKWKQ